jgi:phosphopantetheine--protein transferase-like protein
MAHDDVIAHALEVVEIAEVEAWLARGLGEATFNAEERRYAGSKPDPARRLAARWAAKLAAARVLAGGALPQEIGVVRGHGAPRLTLTGTAAVRHRALGGGPLHVSLTHGLTHAAATVVLESPAE